MVFCNKGIEKDYGWIYSCHNPYFNRWFSAILQKIDEVDRKGGHNPYFNRWFSAIWGMNKKAEVNQGSQSLF